MESRKDSWNGYTRGRMIGGLGGGGDRSTRSIDPFGIVVNNESTTGNLVTKNYRSKRGIMADAESGCDAT